MPPVCLDDVSQLFAPDYGALLLFDEFIVDRNSIDRMREVRQFANYLELITELEKAGLLKQKDFSAVLSVDGKLSIDGLVSKLLEDPSIWYSSFSDAVAIWEEFDKKVRNSTQALNPLDWRLKSSTVDSSIANGMIEGLDRRLLDNLQNWHGGIAQKYRDFTIRVVGGYLEHVFAHLSIADQMGATPIDWEDIEPIYRDIFCLGKRSTGDLPFDQAKSARQFCSVIPPVWKPENSKRFVEMLLDKNLQEFRDMIASSVENGLTFDEEFPSKALDSVYQRYGMLKSRFRSVKLVFDSIEGVPLVGKSIANLGKGVLNMITADSAIRSKKWLLVFCDPRSSWQ